MNKFLLSEQKYHDDVAIKFANIRKRDFIWEIPEQLFLLKPRYFIRKRVIDMGCGPAINVKNILSNNILNNCEYIGVDVSKQMLNLAKKNIPSGLFICSDMSSVKIEIRSVDTILSFGALHHAENKKKTIYYWFNLLKPGGYLLMREPLFEALQKGNGASPMEEGIELSQILFFFKKNKIKLKKLYYFGSPLFHFINKVMKKIMGSIWLNTKLLWYPLMIVDILISTVLQNKFNAFKADSVLLVAQKV